jgi:16S rRNA (guanine(966)-N(2))-methyltransferase RsmD
MRIITGSAKGIQLETLSGEDITRPTTERVKEAIFSMLQFELEGTRVLEPFGGSGQLTLEALSRGAASAVIGDSHASAVSVIRKNILKTGMSDKVRLLQADYKTLLKGLAKKETFDIVFLDPPYAMNLIPDALDRLYRSDLLALGAIIVCESDDPHPIAYEGLTLRRFSKYGRIFITVLEKLAVEKNTKEMV